MLLCMHLFGDILKKNGILKYLITVKFAQ